MSDDNLYLVPVVKAKGETISVDASALPDASFRGVVAAGLKACINTGTSKITKDQFTDAKGNYDEIKHKAAAMEKAAEKLKALMDGSYKFGRAAAAKTDHKLTVEATRIARDVVKQMIKDSGKRVTSFKASQITAAAKELLAMEDGADIWAQAKANLESVKTPKAFKLSISEDPDLVAKNAEKNAKQKLDLGQLSAAKAGKTSVKTRPAHLN